MAEAGTAPGKSGSIKGGKAPTKTAVPAVEPGSLTVALGRHAIRVMPDFPLNIMGDIVQLALHQEPTGGIGSIALEIRHRWVSTRNENSLTHETYYYAILVGDQLGPLIPHLGNDPQALKGRVVILSGTPQSGQEELVGRTRKNLIRLRHAWVQMAPDPAENDDSGDWHDWGKASR